MGQGNWVKKKERLYSADVQQNSQLSQVSEVACITVMQADEQACQP